MQAMVTARAIIDMQKQGKKYGNLEIDVKINITTYGKKKQTSQIQ